MDSGFVNLVRSKGFSMFMLIPEDKFETGLVKLESDLAQAAGSFGAEYSGDTLVWLQKGGSDWMKK